jgi:glycosyltransferase involved in cell wall biosynthesis
MSKPLTILVPCLQDFFSASGKAFTGAQHFTSNFFDYFDHTEHTVIGVALGPRPATKSVTCTTLDRRGKPWLEVQVFAPTADILRYANGYPDPQLDKIVDKLAAAFRRLKPDVFCTNGFSAVYYLFFAAAKKAGLPIVTIHHGIWTMEAKANDTIRRSNLKLRQNTEKQLIRGSAVNIFLTQLSYRLFARQVGRVPRRQRRFITLPYNPIFATSKKSVSPAANTASRKHIRVGLIGRWDPVKNHAAYLALAKTAQQQNLPWKFLAATTPTPALEALQPIYEDYLQHIETFGHMDPATLKKFYQKLDIIVVPSHLETFCGVVMEAVLQHKPVLIAPKVGWVDTFKAYGLRSWVISFRNPRRVLRRMHALLDEQPPADLVEAIRRQNHPQAVFAEYEKIFTEVAEAYAHSPTRI